MNQKNVKSFAFQTVSKKAQWLANNESASAVASRNNDGNCGGCSFVPIAGFEFPVERTGTSGNCEDNGFFC